MNKDKFNSCKFRSDTEITEIIVGCCYSTEVTGHKCFRKGLLRLSPLTCINCDLYEKKTISAEN